MLPGSREARLPDRSPLLGTEMPSVFYDNFLDMNDLSFFLIFSPNIPNSAIPTAANAAEVWEPVSGNARQGLAGAGRVLSELEGSSQDVPALPAVKGGCASPCLWEPGGQWGKTGDRKCPRALTGAGAEVSTGLGGTGTREARKG